MRNYCRLFFIICILLPIFVSAHQTHLKIVDRSNQTLILTSNDNDIKSRFTDSVGKISPMSSYSIFFNMPVSSSSNNGVWLNIQNPNGIAEKLDFRMESSLTGRIKKAELAKLIFDNHQPFSLTLDNLDSITTTADKTTVKWNPNTSTPIITVFYPGVQAISYYKVGSKTNILHDVKKLLWLSDSYEEKQDNSRYALSLAFKAYGISLKVMKIASEQNDEYTQPSVAELKDDYSHIIFDIGAQLSTKYSGKENWSIFFSKIDNFIDNFIQSNRLKDKKIICLIDKSKLADNGHDTQLYRILDHLKARLEIKFMEIAYIENQANYQDLQTALNISIKDYNTTDQGLQNQKDRNIRHAQTSVTNKEQEITDIKHQIDQAKFDNQKLQLDLGQNNLDKSATGSTIKTLETEKGKIETDLANIKLQELQAYLDVQNKIVHDAGKDVDERRVAGFALNGIQAQIATETDKKSQLDIQLGKVNQQLTDAQGKLENLENQQSEIDQKIRENQASILSDKKALLEKQKELSTLETELKKQQ